MNTIKKVVKGKMRILFLLFIMLLLPNQIVFATENRSNGDPYEALCLYDQKERLYDQMEEEEWGAFLTILKYLTLDHLAKMPEEFRTEGEIEEAVKLYCGTKHFRNERGEKAVQEVEDFDQIEPYTKNLSYMDQNEKKDVTDFETYKEYLQTYLSLDVEKCFHLFYEIDVSETEEELVCARESLANYLKEIAVPNESLSKDQITQLFQSHSTPLEEILKSDQKAAHVVKAADSGLRAGEDQVFAYGMRGDIATITVTEYYKGGGWKIHDQWSEGYLVTGKEGVILGNEEPIFCADPNKMFQKGYYSKKNYPFPETVTKIIAAALYKQRQVEEYSWLTKDYQYIAQQCIIWNVENEYKKWITADRPDSRLRLEFGNGVHFPKPHQDLYISDRVFKLVEECIAWAKEHYHSFLDARAEYYVKADVHQPIVRFYGTYTPSGMAYIKKSSSNPTVTDGNIGYQLEGAQYGIFEDPVCTKKIATLQTDVQGMSNQVKLRPGQYWVKEIKAPKGYYLDSTIYPISITSNQTQELKLSDRPYLVPCEILIQKIDQETSTNTPQGNATFEKAEFEVKYYDGIYNPGEDPGTLGKSPKRSWVFQTNKEGIIHYEEGDKISGDALYTAEEGKPMLPLGTLTIQEKKAPEGYQINPTIYVVQLKNEEGNKTPPICQKTIVPETLLKVDIQKTLKGTKQPIENVTFTHIRPNGSKETIATDTKGEASFLGLEYGKHKIIETKVPDGYVLLPEEIILLVDEKNQITLENDSASKPIENVSFSIQKNGNGLLLVENEYVEYSLQIQKENEMHQILEGAQFTLYEDEKCTQMLERKETNQDGIALFKGLHVERCYYLKETAAPKGYPLPFNKDGSEIVYKIKAVYNSNHKELEYYINDKRQNIDQSSGEFKHPILSFKIINYKGGKLPETGNSKRMTIFVVSILCLTYWLFQKRRVKLEI